MAVIDVAKRPIQLTDEKKSWECTAVWVWNEKMSITMCQIFIQPKLLISYTHTHTYTHGNIHRALACLHLSPFFWLCTLYIQYIQYICALYAKPCRSANYTSGKQWLWARKRELDPHFAISSVDSLVWSIYFIVKTIFGWHVFALTKITKAMWDFVLFLYMNAYSFFQKPDI